MKYWVFLIALALPAYLIRFDIFGIPTTLLEILIYIATIFGLLNLKKANRIPLNWFLPIGLLFLAAILAVFISPEKRAGLGELKAFFIDPLLVWWLAVSYLKKDEIVWPIHGLIGASLIVSSHAIWQKISGFVTSDNRVVGIFGYSPNYLSLFLAPLAILIFAWLVEQKKSSKILTTVYCLSFGLSLLALWFSGSRSGLLAVLAGLAFYWVARFWSIIRQKAWLLFLLIGILLLSLAIAWLAFRPDFSLSPESGKRAVSSNNIRWLIWEKSIELGRNHPFVGVGLANFQPAFTKLSQDNGNFQKYVIPWAHTPHNIFLMFWLSTGLIGLTAFIWLIVNFFRQTKDPVLIASMAGLLLQGLVDTPYFKNDLSLIFWLFLAFVLLLKKD